MSPRPLRLCTISLLLLAFLISCSSGDSEFQSPAPQALIDLGIPLTVYAVTTIEPDKHWDFEFDPQENLYKGRILVPTGSTFDITVVYEGDISSTQRVELEHLVRKNITAVGEEMTVAYVGEESNWEAVYEGTPGLDLDGDGFGNLAEYVYKSDLYSKNSIPQGGPSASATRKDLLTNNSVSLPKPGSSFLESLTGTEEIVVEALSIIPIQEMSVIFPTYGVQVLTPAADILKTKKMTVLVETDRFVVGNDVGTITLKVRIKDKYGLVKETPLTFSAFNKEDTKGPSRVRLDLKKDQEINGPTSFIWELDDPSGLEAVSVRLNGNGVERLLGVADQDSSVTRLLANLSFPVNIPDGSYEVIFSARDSSLKHNAYEERVPIKFRRTSSQVPVISNVRLEGNRLPGDFTIAWDGSDPDGNEDIAGYDVVIAPAGGGSASGGNGSPVITCSNLTENRLVGGGDYRSVCQLKRTAYGEMVYPLTLGAKSDYRMEVKAVDYQGLSSSPVVGTGTILDNNLVSWWRFEEGSGSGARDSTGLNTGLLSGPQWVNGVKGQGLLFNGVSDYVALSSNGFPTGASPRSIFLWFRWDDVIAGGVCNNYRNPFWYGSEVNDGMNRIDLSGCSTPTVRLVGINNDTTPVTTGMTQGVWNQLGYTYDGKMVRIYWNGVLISEEEKGWNTVPGMAEIGRRVGANSFKGAIDEVSVYNKALTEDEIRRDCRRNDPTGTTCPDPKSPIILMPTLNLPLPPTKALFAWRSEKDPVGKLMYPDLNYDVRFDRDDNNNGIFTDANFDRMNMEPLSEPKKNSLGSWYYVEERNPAVITTSRGYRLRICPSGTGCAISNDTDPQRATRTFSTLGSGSASWWSFDEASGAAVDSIGTINGQLVNELGRTTGINGSALSLDDWNDYVNLSDAPDLRFDNGSSFMIEGWVRRNSIDSSTDETIFSKMDMTYPSGTGYYFAIHSGGNIGNDRVPDTLDFIMRQQNSNTQLMIEVGTEATIADTNWHHVAVSYTGSVLVKASSIRLYMDGQPQRVITFKDDTLGSVNTLAEARIGASRRWCDYRFEDCSGVATSYDNVFNGLIDEVMVVQDDLNPSNLSPAVICNSYLTTCLAAGLSCDFSCVPQ